MHEKNQNNHPANNFNVKRNYKTCTTKFLLVNEHSVTQELQYSRYWISHAIEWGWTGGNKLQMRIQPFIRSAARSERRNSHEAQRTGRLTDVICNINITTQVAAHKKIEWSRNCPRTLDWWGITTPEHIIRLFYKLTFR